MKLILVSFFWLLSLPRCVRLFLMQLNHYWFYRNFCRIIENKEFLQVLLPPQNNSMDLFNSLYYQPPNARCFHSRQNISKRNNLYELLINKSSYAGLCGCSKCNKDPCSVPFHQTIWRVCFFYNFLTGTIEDHFCFRFLW